MVYILLKPGFEEIEALSAGDILRRGEVECRFAGDGAKPVRGAHGIFVTPDMATEDLCAGSGDMIIVPGGMGGVTGIEGCERTMGAIRAAAEAGASLGAICAGPRVYAKLGLLEGRNITCYPGMEDEMGQAEMCDADAVSDGKIITGRAAGAAFAFGLALITALCGEETARRIAQEVVFR